MFSMIKCYHLNFRIFMYQKLDNIEECYSCGLFIEKDKQTKLSQRCPRCNSKLSVDKNLAKQIDNIIDKINDSI